MVVILFALIFSTVWSYEQSVAECVLNSLISYSKLNALNNLSKQEQSEDLVLFMLQQKGSDSAILLVNEIVENFELLPANLKYDLELCNPNHEFLNVKCEEVYGKNNCEKKNSFGFGPKCPEGYLKNEQDSYSCIKQCPKDESVIVINSYCYDHSIRLYNTIKVYNSLRDCHVDHPFCKKIKNKKQFKGTCGMHEQELDFMCIGRCLNEMKPSFIEKIKSSKRYCLEDSIYIGPHVIEN